MIFSEKGFEKEIKALKEQGGFGDALSEQEMAKGKQRMMMEVGKPNSAAAHSLSWREKNHNLIRYIVSIGVGLSLVGGTTFASNGTLPGDPLYPIKRVKEKIELALAATDQAKADLEITFAQKRLDELQSLSQKFLPNHQGNPSSTPGAANNQDAIDGIVKTKAQINAEADFNSALDGLKNLQEKFDSQGNQKDAADIQAKILKLQSSAALEHLKLNNDIDDNDPNNSSNGTNPDVHGTGTVNTKIRLRFHTNDSND